LGKVSFTQTIKVKTKNYLIPAQLNKLVAVKAFVEMVDGSFEEIEVDKVELVALEVVVLVLLEVLAIELLLVVVLLVEVVVVVVVVFFGVTQLLKVRIGENVEVQSGSIVPGHTEAQHEASF
jgi:hypothetical protein